MSVLTTKQLAEQKRIAELKHNEGTITTTPQTTTEDEPEAPEIIDIRARQSEIEREAETAKATVREVARVERRGRELPYKPQRTTGIAGAVTDIEKSRKEAQAKGRIAKKAIEKILAEHEKQLKAIDEYESGDGYDLVTMIQDGYTTKKLAELGFSIEAITKARSRVDELTKADKYKGDTGYDVVAMVNDGWTQTQLESLFGKDAAQEGIARADVIKRADKYKSDTGYDVAAMVRDNFPQADMDLLFDSDTITHATDIVKLDTYKTETGYNLLAIFDAGYGQNKLMNMGFDEEAVHEAWNYYLGLEALEPYKTGDGTYDLVAISKAVDKGHIQIELVDLVLGQNPPQYLTVAQVHQLRIMNYELAKVNAEAWGISVEQLDQIRAAPTDVAAKVYAYLQETAPSSIELTHPSQLPSFQQTPDWQDIVSALQDIEPYKLEGNEYDVAKAYQDMIAGKLSKQSFIIAFGNDAYKDTKAFYNANVEIKPGQWVAKTEWEGLTPAQQSEVIATGSFTTVDTTKLVELKTGEYVSQEDWNKLDITAQSYLQEHGVDKFNADYAVEVAEPSQGWFKDTWNGIKTAMVVTDKTKENATTYCNSFGIKNEKVVNGVAQWIQISRMFIPRPTADPRTDPKGYLIETGKALAGYAPLVWVVNWKDMSTTDKIINGALDALMFVTLGLGAGVRALRARPVLKAAKTAGSAATNMNNALRVLAKTPVDDVVRYTKASSTASKAIQASKVADANFVAALERVKVLTPGQLTNLEKASQIKGLKSAIMDVSKAQTELNRAWKGVPKSTLQTMGGKKYITRMARVERAQAAFNNALATFNTKLEPRFKVNPTPEFKGFAMEWHEKILPTLDGGEPIGKPLGGGGGSAGGYGKGGTMSREFYEAQKGKMVESWHKPQPYETTSRVAVMERELTDVAVKEGEASLASPELKLKPFYDMKIKPVYKTATKVGQKAVAPVIKASKVAQTAIAASTLGKGATKAEVAIANQTTIAIGKVMVAVTGKNQPMTARDWNTQQAIEQVTKGAVRTGIDASTKNVTHSQLEELVATDIKQGVRSITDTRLRTQLQLQVKTMTRLVTKLVTKVATKYGKETKTIKGKPRLRVNLPEAETDKKGRPIYPEGTVVFQMGKLKRGGEYKAMLPPYDQTKLVSSKLPPKGMTRTQGTPQQTLTFIGGKVPFSDVSADLGITDVFVDVKKRKIHFKGHGLQTDVGRRIPGPTRGVSLANNNMSVKRQGQVFITRVRGSRGVALSRFNPRRRRRQ